LSGSIIRGFIEGQAILAGKKVRLRPKGLADAVEDYQWRQDSELCRLDAAEPVSMPFEEYIKYCALAPAFSVTSSYFGIDTVEGKHIGNCSYFNIDQANGEAEMGIMVGNKEYWDQGYGTDAILTLLDYVFSSTQLERIYLKTQDWNQRAQKCFKKCGFKAVSLLKLKEYNFIIMEIHHPRRLL
jgi:RimJ/RimL family protein N-acetyltransferase